METIKTFVKDLFSDKFLVVLSLAIIMISLMFGGWLVYTLAFIAVLYLLRMSANIPVVKTYLDKVRSWWSQ